MVSLTFGKGMDSYILDFYTGKVHLYDGSDEFNLKYQIECCYTAPDGSGGVGWMESHTAIRRVYTYSPDTLDFHVSNAIITIGDIRVLTRKEDPMIFLPVDLEGKVLECSPVIIRERERNSLAILGMGSKQLLAYLMCGTTAQAGALYNGANNFEYLRPEKTPFCAIRMERALPSKKFARFLEAIACHWELFGIELRLESIVDFGAYFNGTELYRDPRIEFWQLLQTLSSTEE